MIEHSKKATFVIAGTVLVILIVIPVLMYTQKFEVDEKSVWFSVEGIPHCPYCYTIVEPFTGFCNICKKHFRWMDKQEICWHCGGQKTCHVCRGSGYYPYGRVAGQEECHNCEGTGKCPICLKHELSGYNIWGWSSVRHESQRQ